MKKQCLTIVAMLISVSAMCQLTTAPRLRVIDWFQLRTSPKIIGISTDPTTTRSNTSLITEKAIKDYVDAFVGGGGGSFVIHNPTGQQTGRLSIDTAIVGNVGIGTSSPTQKLHVNGNVRFSGALMPNGGAGSPGYMLVSNGPNVAPSWIPVPVGGGGSGDTTSFYAAIKKSADNNASVYGDLFGKDFGLQGYSGGGSGVSTGLTIKSTDGTTKLSSQHLGNLKYIDLNTSPDSFFVKAQTPSGIRYMSFTVADGLLLNKFRYAHSTAGNGKVLTSDASGNATWETPVSGGTTETASQGLNKVGNDIRLGGGFTGVKTLSGSGGGEQISISSQNGTGTEGLLKVAHQFGTPAYFGRNAGDNSANSTMMLTNWSNAATNAPSNVLTLEAYNPSAAAIGYGTAINFQSMYQEPNIGITNRILSRWTNISGGSRSAEFVIAGTNAATVAELFTLSGNGRLKLNKYGINTFTGTPAYSLGVDASGNVVEYTPASGGGVSSIAFGYGLAGGTVTTSGSVTADTTSTTGLVSKTRLAATIAAATVTMIPKGSLYKDGDSLKSKIVSVSDTGDVTPAMRADWDLTTLNEVLGDGATGTNKSLTLTGNNQSLGLFGGTGTGLISFNTNSGGTPTLQHYKTGSIGVELSPNNLTTARAVEWQDANGTMALIAADSINTPANIIWQDNIGRFHKAAVPAGGGGVSSLSVASSNGFAGSSSGGATPVVTISTSVNGMVKGNGTAISAATSGTDYISPNGTETMTNKRINPRFTATTSSATPTPNADTQDQFNLTALAANATFAAPTGTPVDGQSLLMRIKDNGTARTLAWNAIYRAGTDFALPTTTVISKTMYVQFIYNGSDSKWDAVGLSQGF